MAHMNYKERHAAWVRQGQFDKAYLLLKLFVTGTLNLFIGDDDWDVELYLVQNYPGISRDYGKLGHPTNFTLAR